MLMFRVQDNVPEVYINESRDFQILARLSDVLFSGIKYDIDSMVNILDATLTKDRMLQLMCTKIGFFPKIEIDAQVLKYIIASFPFIIKNKGNVVGIESAVNAILKAENNPDAIGKPKVIIVNKEGDNNRDPYTVYIYTSIQIYNKPALKEILRYVLPAGYAYKILSYQTILDGYDNPDIVKQSDRINIIGVDPYLAASIRIPTDNYSGLQNRFMNAFDTTEITTPATTSPPDGQEKINALLSNKISTVDILADENDEE